MRGKYRGRFGDDSLVVVKTETGETVRTLREVRENLTRLEQAE